MCCVIRVRRGGEATCEVGRRRLHALGVKTPQPRAQPTTRRKRRLRSSSTDSSVTPSHPRGAAVGRFSSRRCARRPRLQHVLPRARRPCTGVLACASGTGPLCALSRCRAARLQVELEKELILYPRSFGPDMKTKLRERLIQKVCALDESPQISRAPPCELSGLHHRARRWRAAARAGTAS